MGNEQPKLKRLPGQEEMSDAEVSGVVITRQKFASTLEVVINPHFHKPSWAILVDFIFKSKLKM